MKTSMHDDDLQSILKNFHELIRLVSRGLSEEAKVSLPSQEDILASEQRAQWLPIPGMYGGFNYALSADRKILTVESWSRIVEGSGQRHVVTSSGSDLVAEGFV